MPCAREARNFTTEYVEGRIRDEALKSITPGEKTVLAVHCHNTAGGQYIDVGLARLVESKPEK